ncbi:hypothetical protein LGH83_18795 [Lichenihabitans sp. PAMC28606]|uniref:BY-kinase domain-containing protein n=1 Tax=Lichenihabitans sp. PAMC28606 TaxID=2880932 RepID=UPI001D09E273|nr:Wzz/FepE/Etk N-terminal domain-containing protein [Lichenihabitans sp. PAMC28606]UDL94519.1 hypothetical protein LGH83_18795 [Lichenihabitans sp. PAMC28606]
MNQHNTLTRPSWPSPHPITDGADDHASARPAEDASLVSVRDMLAVLHANRRMLALWVLLCLALAGAYLYSTPPEYLASTQIILEPRRQFAGAQDAGPGSYPPTLDSAQAESQIQVVKSERILRFVFTTLDLAHTSEFSTHGRGVRDWLREGLSGLIPSTSREAAPALAPLSEEARAFQAFSDRVSVRRIGQSYVLEISYRSLERQQAAKLANSITAAYIRDQIELKASAAQRGSEYLQGRIADVQAEQAAAAEAVRLGTVPDMRLPDSDARVISAALEPLGKAYPQTMLVLSFAAVAGLLIGLSIAAIRYALDRTLHSPQDVWRSAGMACLGLIPRRSGGSRRRLQRPIIALDEILVHPDSNVSAALRVSRTAILAANPTTRHHAIGFVAWSHREGTSTIASNFAHLVAAAGDRVTLIDGHLHQPGLSQTLAPDAESGLNELLSCDSTQTELRPVPLSEALSFVPAVRSGTTSDPNIYLGSPEMQIILVAMRQERSVIIDLPPLSVSSDAQAIGPHLDGLVLVIEAHRTTSDEVAMAVTALRSTKTRILGIILNKTTAGQTDRRAAGRNGWDRFRRHD